MKKKTLQESVEYAKLFIEFANKLIAENNGDDDIEYGNHSTHIGLAGAKFRLSQLLRDLSEGN